jgi:uncharacterized membrane protein YccF (DUF307 family)
MGVFARGFLFFFLGVGMAPVIMSLVLAVFLFVFVVPFPVGRMYLRLMAVQLSPLDRDFSGPTLNTDKRVRSICNMLNVLFFFCGGGFLVFFHILMAFVLFVSIIGYKFALVHLNLLKLVIAPYGRHILAADAPMVGSMSAWQIFNYGRGVYPCCCCDPELPRPQQQSDAMAMTPLNDTAALAAPHHANVMVDRHSAFSPTSQPTPSMFMVFPVQPPPLPPKPARLSQRM